VDTDFMWSAKKDRMCCTSVGSSFTCQKWKQESQNRILQATGIGCLKGGTKPKRYILIILRFQRCL
jgi:hypothetical protein